jgi:hypothetical protein
MVLRYLLYIELSEESTKIYKKMSTHFCMTIIVGVALASIAKLVNPIGKEELINYVNLR